MSKTSGTLTTKELRARVELANLQFEEDKPIDLRALKMRGNLHERDSIAHLLGVWLKDGVHSENIEEMAKEYNDLLAKDYYRVRRALIVKIGKKMGYGEHKIGAERSFIIQMLIQAALPTTPAQETWDLIEILEKKLERSRESTEHLADQVMKMLEKEKDYELWV